MTPAQIVLPLALVVLAATGAASTPEPPAERGAAVYAAHCASCHGADLKGVTGTHAPDLTDDYWLFGGDDLDSFKVPPLICLAGRRSSQNRKALHRAMPMT
jgi:cytochrome c oxidase cbb3-type subunit 3